MTLKRTPEAIVARGDASVVLSNSPAWVQNSTVDAIHDQLKETIYVNLLQAMINRWMIHFFFRQNSLHSTRLLTSVKNAKTLEFQCF